MKKLVIVFAVIIFTSIQANAYDISEYWQIKSTLRKYDQALSEQNIEKIKSFFDKDYKSSDNFTLDEILQMLEKTYNAYGKMNQKTKINNITITGGYAIVQLTDKTKALIYPDKNKTKEKRGILKGESVYALYFKKTNQGWKIFYDEILSETTSLKYGIANKIPMELNTPLLIKKNQEYNLSLKIDKPENIIALASISNEKIEYPTPDYKEKFRKFPSTGELERIVKANNNNKGEYAIASVGFTKVSVNEQETKARIEVVGIAYLMKRINMLPAKDENEK